MATMVDNDTINFIRPARLFGNEKATVLASEHQNGKLAIIDAHVHLSSIELLRKDLANDGQEVFAGFFE